MVRRNSGLTASGQTQSEIRPGDIWKDHHGSRVIILSASPLSVEYRRVGYDATCISSPARFVRDFEYLKGNVNENDVARFMGAADGDEKIRVLREIIQERMYRK